MKYKSLIIPIFTMILITLFAEGAFAVKRIVQVGNFFFNPATVSANVGDTMRWVWVAGFHTTTSTVVPPGAATWDVPITSSNQTYEYKISIAGNYTYFCKVHGLGMSGSFTATIPPPTLSVSPSNQNVTGLPGATSFSVTSNASWTVTSDATWCTVTPGGIGNGSITANYSTNPEPDQRIATITVTVSSIPAQTVTVTQAGSPPELTLQGLAISTGQSLCFNAGQSIIVAGGNTTFLVSAGGSATMIAGENINYLPGTTIAQGGSLLGYITTNGQFCDMPVSPAMGIPETANPGFMAYSGRIIIYPNPTKGDFLIEYENSSETGGLSIEIFDIFGNLMMKEKTNMTGKQSLSLAEFNPGLYVIRVNTGSRIETARIIKQ